LHALKRRSAACDRFDRAWRLRCLASLVC